MRFFFLFVIAMSLAWTAVAETAELTSDDDKSIYLMGVSLGRNVGQFDLDEREIAIIKRGLEDGITDHTPAVSVNEYGPKVNEFVERRSARVAEDERKVSATFLAEAKKTPGAITTESGLIFTETQAGNGAKPQATDNVKVHYHGTRSDGSVFDSSRDRGEPVSFPLNGVIACWTEALQRMQVGGKAVIVCPPEIAYGDRGFRGIKPGAALRFEVELLAIE